MHLIIDKKLAYCLPFNDKNMFQDTDMNSLNKISGTEIIQMKTEGLLTAEEVMQDCLKQVDVREKTVKAWAYLDGDLALKNARIIDKNKKSGRLSGLSVGIKDVLDTFDMPTQMGSSIYKGWQPTTDAACVNILRNAGAVIMGKTATCEFAGSFPSLTTNPFNLAHTPGGSSSGSAAAVADTMVHAAFGTQTGGSVIRPASFCGIFGYKPTYNIINRAGLLFAAENLDTIGLMARTIEDIDLIASVLLNRSLSQTPDENSQPLIGVAKTHLWNEASPESRTAVENAVKELSRFGAKIVETKMPATFTSLTNVRNTINDFERSKALSWHAAHHQNQMSDNILKQVQNGNSISWDQYRAALEHAESARASVDAILKPLDFILTPSAHGEAPKGLASTGDARFQGYWTILHTPTITLPTHSGPNGLPVGIQIVGPRYGDTSLISWAKWVTKIVSV
ncbi:MAG: amidase [Rhodospirillaceae bacterium]|nr:amidase [Rhodospirillaceae bacterium]